MRSHQVEFSSEIGQGNLTVDLRDHAAHVEELGQSAKNRFLVAIETDALMPEQTADVEKISRAAAKIENAQRPCAIEPKVLHPLHVHADPVISVLVGVDLSRIRPPRTLLAQADKFILVDRGEDSAAVYRMQCSRRVFPETGKDFGREELLNFSREPHGEKDADKSATNKPGAARRRPIAGRCMGMQMFDTQAVSTGCGIFSGKALVIRAKAALISATQARLAPSVDAFCT